MSGFLDFISQGSPSTSTSGSSSSSTLPAWYMQYAVPALNNAATVASQPFPNYASTGMPRIADFTPMQKESQQMVQQNASDYQPYQDAATAVTANAAQPYSSSTLQQYLSPYLSGVTNAIQQQGMNLWNEQLMPGIQDAFVGAGQMGSDRMGKVLDEGARDVTQGILSQSALANQNAYNAANTNYLNFNQQGLNAGQQLGALGQLQQGSDLRSAAALDTSGGQQQNLNQQNLNLAYQDFQNQALWPQQQTQFMLNSLNGVAPGQTSTTSGTTQQQGAGVSPLGALAGTYSAYNAFNGSGNTPAYAQTSDPYSTGYIGGTSPGEKSGGLIKFRRGGRVNYRTANNSEYGDYLEAA